MSIKTKTVIWTGMAATAALLSMQAMGVEPMEVDAIEIHQEMEARCEDKPEQPE